MPHKWIYVLACDNDVTYVGSTTRLFRRFWEHDSGNGGLNTSINEPKQILAIYKANTIDNFIHYNLQVSNILQDKSLQWNWNHGYYNPKFMLHNWDNLEDPLDVSDTRAENFIAERFMIHDPPTWKSIRGGKYVRTDIQYSFPDDKHLPDLPMCFCGLPCDVKKHPDKPHLFFRCSRKNAFDAFRSQFNFFHQPCKFYQEYSKDISLRSIPSNPKPQFIDSDDDS